MMMEQALNSTRLELLRQRINEEDYIHAAIQRLAHVLSNELMGITTEGGRNEQQRKRRK
jgi:prephenate dehydrogenase